MSPATTEYTCSKEPTSTGGSRAQRRVCKFFTAGHISAFERVLYTEDFQKRVGFAVFKKQFCHGNVCQEVV